MKLSILIPSITERSRQLELLLDELERQIGELPVEIIVLTDNRKRSIGKKRTDLLNLAKGKYLCMIDDDDAVSEDFISVILQAIESNSDVITFKQKSTLDGEFFIVTFGLKNENEAARREFGIGKYVDIKRKAWHCCVWKKVVVKNCFFDDTNYGEDAIFSDTASANAITETHIDKVMHYYNYSSEKTRAI